MLVNITPVTFGWLVAFFLHCSADTGLSVGSHLKSPYFDPRINANDKFVFTHQLYNGSIYENPIGKVYIKTSVKMGIYLKNPTALSVDFSIIEGDKYQVFKAEKVIVKDFCFLRIRVSTHGILNRESTDRYRLKVEAVGTYPDEKTLKSFTNINIDILDQNDLSPLFPPSPYKIEIQENTPLHTSLLQVKASDSDAGPNGEIYYNFVEPPLQFSIHPTTGVISLSRPVRYNQTREYVLKVHTQDRGISPHSKTSSPNSFTEVFVKVTPANFHSPSIKVHSHHHLIEHGNIGTNFAVLTISDIDDDQHGEIAGVDIVNDPDTFFRLVPGNTKNVYNIIINSDIDRESLPENYQLRVIAADSGSPPRTSTALIPVRVQDINDNEPVFGNQLYIVNVSEAVPLHTHLLTVKATDKDVGSNAEIRYAIVDGNFNNMFEIHPVSGVIRTARDLDREITQKINLVIQASDQANSGSRKTGQTKAIVNIEDFNDNSPDFEMTKDTIIVKENLPKRSLVTTVKAIDDDRGDNGTITFGLLNFDSLPFEIDPFTGDIRTTEVLDFETMQKVYYLHLRVSDRGIPFKREKEMILTIRLQDVNDNRPEFEKVQCSGYLSREAPLSTEVLVLTAIDFDSGNLIEYNIIDGNEDNCFSIVPATGAIIVNCDMSKYHDGSRTLTIVASDGQYASIPTTLTLNLVSNKRNPFLAMDNVRTSCKKTDVTDRLRKQIQMSELANRDVKKVILSDNQIANSAPVIDASFSAYVEVSENAEIGSEILDFSKSVSDKDSHYNGFLSYSISKGDEFGHFKIDTFTGKLRIMSKLDFETQKEFLLTLNVMDNGKPSLRDSVNVKIALLDENDNNPVFEKATYSTVISEDLPVNTTFFKVKATDRDSGDNSKIRYKTYLYSGVSIDAFDGSLKLTAPVDRDSRDSIVVIIEAEDQGLKKLSAVVFVTIKILDINDNAPMFQPESYKVRVREDVPPGTVISTITAYDLDLGENKRISYFFTDGLSNVFELDSLTGVVRIRTKLDYETQQVYNLTITATDNGSPQLSSTTFLCVEVMDVDENLWAPEFSNFVAKGSIPENAAIGSYVMHVHAEDRDTPEHGIGQIVYSIVGGSGLGKFTIDINGTVRTTRALDRETKGHYWLTVHARDLALVPRFARLEVLIEVEDVNDNVPQSIEPAYYASVVENSRDVKQVVQIQATDADYDGSQTINYAITSGNPKKYFSIHPETGMISTTARVMDREDTGEHALEVTISDNGSPPLSSTTRVVIKVVDENDNKPTFQFQTQRITVFETEKNGEEDIFVYRVIAQDRDEGRNSEIRYTLKTKRSHNFRINRTTGEVFSTKSLVRGESTYLMIRASDNGVKLRSSRMRLTIEVLSRPKTSRTTLKFSQPVYREEIVENDQPGQMIRLLSVQDSDIRVKYRYSIVGGNVGKTFSMQPDHGSVFLAKRVDREQIKSYNLTVEVTDGLNSDTAQLLINILDANDNEPVFSHKIYTASVSENSKSGTPVVRVSASDQDENDRLLYSITSAASQSSLRNFRIGDKTGVIVVSGSLDHEHLSRHLLTVEVRDQGVFNKKSYARVDITVLDKNDHVPRFLTESLSGMVYESAAVGTSVLQALAQDSDTGDNAQITYTITSGNADKTFTIDEQLGIISVAKELDMDFLDHFELVISATDNGRPPMSSQTKATIDVTMSSNSPPKFFESNYRAEVSEDSPVFSPVVSVFAESLSTVTYSLLDGNNDGVFEINPNSGMIFTVQKLDYEHTQIYNITVAATNVISATQYTQVEIQVIDVNDNAPEFLQLIHRGNISESAMAGSVVVDGLMSPLVVKAHDRDADRNSQLFYEIQDSDIKEKFSINPHTGAIHIEKSLDYEEQNFYNFSVKVRDLGSPALQAESNAQVYVYVQDENDCQPRFEDYLYQAVLILPTFPGVKIIQLTAHDADSVSSNLEYSIVSGDTGNFGINSSSGLVYVQSESLSKKQFDLGVQVFDGKFRIMSRLQVKVQGQQEADIKLSKDRYTSNITENISTPTDLGIIQPVNLDLNTHVTFTLLNNDHLFKIGYTSGLLSTRGLPFDREEVSNYTVLVKVEAGSGEDKQRSAHAVMYVTVTDDNDNPPMFLHLPYHTTVSTAAPEGQVIQVVTAHDPDLGKNSEIRYQLADSHQDKFAINAYTREVVVKSLDKRDRNKELVLKVIAQDKGHPPLTAVASIHVHVVDSSSPLFEHTYYTASVSENVGRYTPVSTINAISPYKHKLIYSITRGDDFGNFALDFNTAMDTLSSCYLSVLGNLDYETKNLYSLTLRATDIFSGSFAETNMNVTVEDVNDNKPKFFKSTYTETVLESTKVGSSVLQVSASDKDDKANAVIHYSLAPTRFDSPDTEYFYINTDTGHLMLRRPLDHETQSQFDLLVIALDSGMPVLSSTASIHIKVKDLNDNPPVFSQSSYSCHVSDTASKGQFVFKVEAVDPDITDRDKLVYSIVDGNEQQSFRVSKHGVISLTSLKEPELASYYFLNVSVNDGVYSSFTQVTIQVKDSNHHAPRFNTNVYNVIVSENIGAGQRVVTVVATDEDRGYYGGRSYAIENDRVSHLFTIDADRGEITSKGNLDREEQSFHKFTVSATDYGGLVAYATVIVRVKDVNDNAPKFLMNDYQANVAYNSTIGSAIVRIRAVDEDEGENSKLIYSLHRVQDPMVGELFEINAYSGIISSKALLTDSENEVFQFFIRVSDQGEPALENHIPVEILVMGRNQTPPIFPESRRLFFVKESEKIGTVVTTVQAKCDLPLTYAIIRGQTNSSNAGDTFTVSPRGQLKLIRKLDWALTPIYSLFIKTSTLTSPELVDYMELTIKVGDVNNKPPEFSRTPYTVQVAENVGRQYKLLQLQAWDEDMKSRLHFSLPPSMTHFSTLFDVHPDSGWITLLAGLDREAVAEYNLTVIVSDVAQASRSFGLTSTSNVIITVVDVNDNPPTFSSNNYVTSVNEGALSDTGLLRLSTTDLDTTRNSDVTFYIVEGDQTGRFQIANTGELRVKRELDRETQSVYHLRVAATDMAHVTYTTVTVDILDDNDNSPVCDQRVKEMEIDEDVVKGTAVAHIQATDRDDPNTYAQLRYTILGPGSQYFYIDKRSGLVKTAKLFDRETTESYKLVVEARDGGGLTCTTALLVNILDVNDNPPTFPKSSIRHVYNIKEDAKVRTLLTRMVAVDPDLGVNSQIRYKLAEGSSPMFQIDPNSGIISVAEELDRESMSSYNLTVVAYNPLPPQLSSQVSIHINILDVNDNQPEFERSVYSATVDETVETGHEVTRVRATSLDIGLNAQMRYSITAGNEHERFEIDKKTGVVKVSKELDYESSKEYFITVLATDSGSPPLTNTAIISINVTDSNDNAPQFSQDTYTIHVKENTDKGTDVFQVVATDADSDQNSAITYSIIDGNSKNHFSIHPTEGTIQLRQPLDREEIRGYSLVIQAQDSGLPMRLSSAVLSVVVDDVNDNPPVFGLTNYTGLVQEGRRTGIEIITLSVTDADLPENGRPFTFELIHGNENGEFHIDDNGVISTAGKLSKKIKDRHFLQVRVYDNGNPQQYSDTLVTVEVVDDSVFPPTVRNLRVVIRSCMDDFLGGVIGRVEARDRDPYDKVIYSIVSANSHLFNIHRDDGRLIALTGLDPGEYKVNVSVSDGKFLSFGEVIVEVVCTSKEVLNNAVTIQFENLIVEQFFANFKTDFQNVIKDELNVRIDDVEILNVQLETETNDSKHRSKRSDRKFKRTSENLDVLFAVKKSPDKYFNKRSLKRKIVKIRGRIESVLGATVVDIFTDKCSKSSCDVGQCVGKVEFDQTSLVPVVVNGASFVSAKHRYTYQCVCLEGDCEEHVCGDTTCTANKMCKKTIYGDYSCQCPKGRTGEMCETLMPLCNGNTCPLERPMTFSGKSYGKWRLQHSTKKRFSLQFRIRTRHRNAVLMYAKGKVDYSILQIEDGSLVYKFDCGSGEGVIRIPVDLSDGQWHLVELDRNGREAELALDSAYTAVGISPGVHAILNVESEFIYFGAEVDQFPNGFKEISNGFEGCFEDIRVFNIPLPLKGSNQVAEVIEFQLVEFHCQDYPAMALPVTNVCSTNPCLNGGKCTPSGLNSYICVCRDPYFGDNCELNPNPCISAPCKNGGHCEIDTEVPNSYLCRCTGGMTGMRCTYGTFCLPNPCQQAGVCIDGPTAALCDCSLGFHGLTCERSWKPCDRSPCMNSGICTDLKSGGYSCNCTDNYHGNNCQYQVIDGRSQSSDTGGSTSIETIFGVIGAVVVVIIIIAVVAVVCVCRRKRRRKRQTSRDLNGCGSEISLKGLKDKRCKVSNPDLSVKVEGVPSQRPPMPPRPTSYTPSNHDSMGTLNNLDSVRNYGSAGDDLESTGTRHIIDYCQHIEAFANPRHGQHHGISRATPPLNASRTGSESDSIQKQPWEFEYPNILEHYEGDKKQHDKMAKLMPGIHSPKPSPSLYQGKERKSRNSPQQETSSVSSLTVSEADDEFNGYHWDTSDWATGPSMPNISEIPTNEIQDSPSSQASDDCNANAEQFPDDMTTAAIYNMSLHSRENSPLLGEPEQRQNNLGAPIEMLAHIGAQLELTDTEPDEMIVSDIFDNPDYFEDSEYVGDSEYAENEPYEEDDLPPSYADHPKYEQLLQDCEDNLQLPNMNVHPNQYLLEIDPLTEDENTDAGEDTGAETDPLRPPREFMTPGYFDDTDNEGPSRLSLIDDGSVSMGGFTGYTSNASCSDISGLCEIEDSEVNATDTDDENAPLNPDTEQTRL